VALVWTATPSTSFITTAIDERKLNSESAVMVAASAGLGGGDPLAVTLCVAQDAAAPEKTSNKAVRSKSGTDTPLASKETLIYPAIVMHDRVSQRGSR